MNESDSDQDHQPAAPPGAELKREKSELGRDVLYRAVISGTEADAERKFVAAKSAKAERYVERFRRFDEAGGIRPGWHWPAFFVTFPWLFFRRMYLVSALYFFLSIILSAFAKGSASETAPPESPAQLFSEMSSQDIALIFSSIFLFSIVPAILADGVYWWHVNRMIRRAERKFADPLEQIAWLREGGGTSSVWVLLLVLVLYAMFSTWMQ